MEIELKSDYSTDNPDDAVIMAARGDYMSESLVGKGADEALDGTEKGREEFIAQLLRRGHFGPFEHAQAYFAVEGISRVAMAQVTRHRHMSFDVQSQRYVNFEEKEPVIPPSFEECEEEIVERHPSGVATITFDGKLKQHWRESVGLYQSALDAGIPKEDARFFLPQATPVNMTFSANARTLMHFFDIRNSGKAQWEAQEFARALLDECREWAPLTFSAYEEYVNHNSLRAP